MITIIVTVLVLVYKRFCNTVCIYGHANKASSCCCCCYITEMVNVHSLKESGHLARFNYLSKTSVSYHTNYFYHKRLSYSTEMVNGHVRKDRKVF